MPTPGGRPFKGTGALPNSRLVVTDANINPRISTTLENRGRRSVSCKRLGLDRLRDPPLLDALATKYADEDWVLLTADDDMPADHGPQITRLGLTIATIGGENRPQGEAEEKFIWETAHRWVHHMADPEHHPREEIRRYYPTSHGAWIPKRRHRR